MTAYIWPKVKFLSVLYKIRTQPVCEKCHSEDQILATFQGMWGLNADISPEVNNQTDVVHNEQFWNLVSLSGGPWRLCPGGWGVWARAVGQPRSPAGVRGRRCPLTVTPRTKRPLLLRLCTHTLKEESLFIHVWISKLVFYWLYHFKR